MVLHREDLVTAGVGDELTGFLLTVQRVGRDHATGEHEFSQQIEPGLLLVGARWYGTWLHGWRLPSCPQGSRTCAMHCRKSLAGHIMPNAPSPALHVLLCKLTAIPPTPSSGPFDPP